MLVVDQISKSFPDFSLSGITFKVNQGDYFMLLGPSGAGKSLLLQIIAGLVEPSDGRILFSGRDITNLPIGKRQLGLLFQDLALFPHMTVYSNIAYPLKVRKVDNKTVKRKVEELAFRFSIEHLISKNVTSLSGGEKQRVALARTIALAPPLLLLDEPLSAVDSQLHLDLRALLRGINSDGTTVIHVTHNYEEAISLANRVGVLNRGTMAQVGNTLDVFQNPQSDFVAKFTGAKNFFRVTSVNVNANGLASAEVPSGKSVAFYTERINPKGFVCFSEDSVVLSTQIESQSALNVFSGKVIDIFAQRFGFEVVVDCGEKIFALVTRESLEKLNIVPGTRIFASVKANAVKFIPEI